ncbi:hypothetical protein [Fodinicola acaciae]|uniref:hypothetical protein n=1 Tax=Fodinicola acaciae TaxID=2681555 RepID=UPI0013D3E173|nr:hypothetical protein [Fodinicola acaciae]
MVDRISLGRGVPYGNAALLVSVSPIMIVVGIGLTAAAGTTAGEVVAVLGVLTFPVWLVAAAGVLVLMSVSRAVWLEETVLVVRCLRRRRIDLRTAGRVAVVTTDLAIGRQSSTIRVPAFVADGTLIYLADGKGLLLSGAQLRALAAALTTSTAVDAHPVRDWLLSAAAHADTAASLYGLRAV